ncbi:hypothetical protein Pmani_033846 [Petrolisthes manimaculis]|uniref:Reverse transcriptase n=1 Tax=Petrolisthes manimaculis TaxID=1843537 RepID=A0AAE1NNX5_9EUCA|nr:hypothetical protein Pmani_033846 [Petrolisthes manimaculis]
MSRLDEWSRKWLLNFNAGKCKTMHVGRNNLQADYHLNGTPLQKTTEERDLGILVSFDLKPSQHVAKVAAKANSRLGIIKRNFIRDREILVPLYLSLVRPVMDYGVQSWSPYLVKDIQALEKVQRRATKLVPELSHLPYEERCQRLGLQTLSDRRKRGDMIQTYKLLHGFDDHCLTGLGHITAVTYGHLMTARGHTSYGTQKLEYGSELTDFWRDLDMWVFLVYTHNASIQNSALVVVFSNNPSSYDFPVGRKHKMFSTRVLY